MGRGFLQHARPRRLGQIDGQLLPGLGALDRVEGFCEAGFVQINRASCTPSSAST